MEHQYTKPLPQCDGPKLKPFHDPKATLLFHRLISDKDAEGNCAHVFEVSIGSTKYALKVVGEHPLDLVVALLLSSNWFQSSNSMMSTRTTWF